MQPPKLRWQAACVAVAIGLFAGCSGNAGSPVAAGKVAGAGTSSEADDVVLALGDVPPAVVAAIESAAPGGLLSQVVLEDENGQQVYGAEVTDADGKRLDIKVDPAGSVLKIEEDDEDDAIDGEHGDDLDTDDVDNEVEDGGVED